ncbi:glutamine amidotransferase [Corynebacterium sp. zg254]|uniref:Lipid II isoglutaminyl synthase (glutamine-hydrolyzing) subunit GatD n=1 Tax=Corynebacterium zhongnanshanii TaxID=2768834 RepID=A0ABQ6VBV8_9CORY|nr:MULTISPECIES: glutamine amidotransferase [Corynebacterium]KAB3519129.1 glutamine amidotransferase [Corynebacterium zhongnanshanii]MCR5914968.1 glutamine amidotransferase [Corynebacterium sp. zg254]
MTSLNNSVTIGLILPDVLGTYGDDGNALVLRQRARMRGLDAEIQPITLGDPVPDNLSMYTVGGGEDVAQILAAEHLQSDGGIFGAAEAGRPILAICAGLQVFGHSFRASGRMVDGLGLLDATTSSLEKRMIGEIASTPAGGTTSGTTGGTNGSTQSGTTGSTELTPSERIVAQLTEPLTGFANHMGATILGPAAKPLGRITRGTGNTDAHGASLAASSQNGSADVSQDDLSKQVAYEGAIQGSVLATYMHGPALARNPQLADAILAEVLGTTIDQLPEMTSSFAEQLDGEVRRLRSERLG